MERVYIDYYTYMQIMQKAAENNGRAILEAKGFDPVEITIDAEYAKKEWAKIERVINKFIDIHG